MGQVVNQAAALSVTTLVLLIVSKGLADGILPGQRSWRPDVPGDVPGIVGGLLASHVGFAETPAVAALMEAGAVPVLGLPLSSVILAMVVSQAGLSTAPHHRGRSCRTYHRTYARHTSGISRRQADAHLRRRWES